MIPPIEAAKSQKQKKTKQKQNELNKKWTKGEKPQ